MSVLVKGMEKPEHCGYCRFRYDGICHALQKTQYSMDECPLVPVIRCKYCKHWIDHRCRKVRSLDDWRKCDDYCSFAEGKEE